MDHVVPVVGPEGFTTFDEYITRLFCNVNGFAAICASCHQVKTQLENEERRDTKKSIDKS